MNLVQVMLFNDELKTVQNPPDHGGFVPKVVSDRLIYEDKDPLNNK
jgi:hypothetical protein